ncbi:hypothetical protein ACFLSG_02940 [Candidatus Bipolaricaulota bacterium]
MSSKQATILKLLRENPQAAILVAELLGPPLGLRTPGGSGEQS